MRFSKGLFVVWMMPLLAVPIFLPSMAVHASGGDSYSAWHGTDGDGKIQYRWYTYGGDGTVVPKCSYQIRNLDSSDAKRYDSTVYYTSTRGNSVTEDGPYLDKIYRENSGNIMNCINISSVTTRAR